MFLLFVFSYLVQNKSGDGKDFLVYRQRGNNYQTQTNIPLVTQSGILLLPTYPANFTEKQKNDIRLYVTNMSDGQQEGMLFHFKINKVCPVLIMNEGTLTDQEVLRLDHWRHAHRLTSGERHTERCPACAQAKHKHAMKVKLYASTKQFPAILYQILQEVESEGYAVRELYVDTFIVNISLDH